MFNLKFRKKLMRGKERGTFKQREHDELNSEINTIGIHLSDVVLG
jgi:hypothetical protein